MSHPEITNTVLRQILANELLVMRRQFKRLGITQRDDPFFWSRVSFETALRRVNTALLQGVFDIGTMTALAYGDADLRGEQ